MNKLGQLSSAIIAGITGYYIISFYNLKGFAVIGVFFILFLVIGITFEYIIRFLKK